MKKLSIYIVQILIRGIFFISFGTSGDVIDIDIDIPSPGQQFEQRNNSIIEGMDGDINILTICSQNDSGNCIILMDRNLGATTNDTSSTGSWGYIYQYGNNHGFSFYDENVLSSATSGITIDTSGYGPYNWYDNNIFRIITTDPYDWSSPQNNNLWGDITNTENARQGPCPQGYHIPTSGEWKTLINIWTEQGTPGGNLGIFTYFKNDFKIPNAHGLKNNGGTAYDILWSSSINGNYARQLLIPLSDMVIFTGNRADAAPVRCFKNLNPAEHTVTFDANGGTLTTGSMTVVEGQPYGNLPVPTRTGYTFEGWFLGEDVFYSTGLATSSSDPHRRIYAKNERMFTGGRTLFFDIGFNSTMVYIEINDNVNNIKNYTVTNTGVIGYSLITGPYKYNGSYYSFIDILLVDLENPITVNKFDLVDWNSGAISSQSIVSVDKDHTLYAKWTPNEYTVTFDANGGTCDITGKTVTYDSTYGDLPIPTRTGYTFNGRHGANLFDKNNINIVHINGSTYVTITGNQIHFDGSPVSGNWSSEIWFQKYLTTGNYIGYSGSLWLSTLSHIVPRKYTFLKTGEWNKLLLKENTSKSDPSILLDNITITNENYYTISYNLDYYDQSVAKATISDLFIAQYIDTGTKVDLVSNQTLYALRIDDIVPSTGSISINNDNTHTNTSNVTLNLSATDLGLGMTGGKMRFSCDNNTYSEWEDYTTSKNWSLTVGSGCSAGDGAKTVYVQYRDANGNAATPINDRIILDTTSPTSTLTSTNTPKSSSQRLTGTCEDSVGITQIYFGTSSTPTYTTIDSTTNYSTGIDVTDPGTYYLYCQDSVGHVTSGSKTFYRYEVHNMLNAVNKSEGIFNSTNYPQSSRIPYIALANSTITFADVYTIPTYASSNTYSGYTTTDSGTPSMTASDTLDGDKTYYFWFNRSKYNLTLTKNTGISTIYYKINGVNDWSSTTSSSTLSMKAGSTASVYATASSCYTHNATSQNSPQTWNTVTENKTFSPTATLSTYTVTYNYTTNGGTTANQTGNVNCGTSADLTKTGSKVGYTFVGWNTNPSASTALNSYTVTGDTTLYAIWTPNTNTPYVVNHYLQNTGDNEYTLEQTSYMIGTTDSQTQATANSYPGFTAQTINQQIIAGNGSTEVDIYYDRNIYMINIDLDGGVGASSITGKYGAVVNTPSISKQGYTLKKYYPSIPDTMPLNGANVKAVWAQAGGKVSVNIDNTTINTLNIGKLKVSNNSQIITGSFGSNTFILNDTKCTENGYHATLSVGNLVGSKNADHNITSSNVQIKSNGMSRISGDTVGAMQLSSNITNWTTAAGPITYFTRGDIVIGDTCIGGEYGDNLDIKITIPAHIIPDEYRGVITYTLYEN